MNQLKRDVRKLVKEIFQNISKLKEVEPDYTWGNLTGDYGEYVVINEYNLTKSRNVNKGYDAVDADGKTVQIKAVKTGQDIKFKDENVDTLAVVQLFDDGSWEIVYFGSFEEVKKHKKYSSYSDRFVVSLSKLKKLNKD
jgi:hypothetical protein